MDLASGHLWVWGPNSIVLIPQFLLELGRKSSEAVLVGWHWCVRVYQLRHKWKLKTDLILGGIRISTIIIVFLYFKWVCCTSRNLQPAETTQNLRSENKKSATTILCSKKGFCQGWNWWSKSGMSTILSSGIFSWESATFCQVDVTRK